MTSDDHTTACCWASERGHSVLCAWRPSTINDSGGMMKVSELEGAQLDLWVAKAEGVKVYVDDTAGAVWAGNRTYQPSTDWDCAGPIIEREIRFLTRHGPTRWSALAPGSVSGHGPTPLIAAMRAYVASKFGDEVPDEVA